MTRHLLTAVSLRAVAPKPVPRRSSLAGFSLAAALAVLLAGCDNPTAEKTPDQAQADTQAAMAARDARLLHDPVAIKCRRYSGPAYDGERRRIGLHLRQNPRVASVAVDLDGGEYDPGLTVLLKRGVSATQTRALAHRIRAYMTAHYGGDRALIVREISIHHQASENATAAAFNRVTGDNLGMVGAIVQNGMGDTDTAIDPKWHIEIDGKQVE